LQPGLEGQVRNEQIKEADKDKKAAFQDRKKYTQRDEKACGNYREQERVACV
jgi:hypothetical protein